MEEVSTEAAVRFGPDPMAWVFRCPGCGDHARVGEFPPGYRSRAGQECIGRSVAGRGCAYTSAADAAPWVIVTGDGRVMRSFAFGDVPVIQGVLIS